MKLERGSRLVLVVGVREVGVYVTGVCNSLDLFLLSLSAFLFHDYTGAHMHALVPTPACPQNADTHTHMLLHTDFAK